MEPNEWERSHPWLAGVINGLIIAVAFGFGYSFTSDSNEKAVVIAIGAGVVVAVTRGLWLSREQKKSSS